MGRKPRIEFEGAVYHVTQRGSNREPVFILPEYKAYLLEQLQHAAALGGMDVFAYVIMDNHFHLAVRTHKKPLSSIMHRVNSRFCRYYNRQRGRTGPVYDGRYKAALIDNDNYLLAVVRYIHLNPVRAGLCESAAGYEWSSDACYRQVRSGDGGFVRTEFLLNILDENPKRALEKYVTLMEQDRGENSEDLYLLNPPAPGLLVSRPDSKKASPPKKPLDEILMASCGSAQEYAQIKSGSRRRTLVPGKARYAREALAQGYTLQEIGENIRISAAAVCKLLSGARHLTY